MTAAELKLYFGDAWPYLVVIVIGFLPTEIWRLLAVLLAKDMKEDSDVLLWVKLVASALLAAVVAKIVVAPPGALRELPIWGRILSLAAVAPVLLVLRRSVLVAVLVGEAVLIGSWFVLR